MTSLRSYGPGDRPDLDVFKVLQRADIDVRLRKIDTASRETDLWLRQSDVARAEDVLEREGFRHLSAPGRNGHRFYLSWRNGHWYKLDFKLHRGDPSQPRRRGAAPVHALLRRGPAGRRRLGPIVALVGPDGAGKSTVLAALRERLPLATSLHYLGVRRQPAGAGAQARSPRPPGAWATARETAVVLRRAFLHARRLAGVHAAAWRGRVVICDRHPLEVLVVDPRRSALARVVERQIVTRLLPWPDCIVVLDAPGEVMHARKGERDPDRLERLRGHYREVLVPRGAVVIRTDGPLERAVDEASAVVWQALSDRRRWPSRSIDGD